MHVSAAFWPLTQAQWCQTAAARSRCFCPYIDAVLAVSYPSECVKEHLPGRPPVLPLCLWAPNAPSCFQIDRWSCSSLWWWKYVLTLSFGWWPKESHQSSRALTSVMTRFRSSPLRWCFLGTSNQEETPWQTRDTAELFGNVSLSSLPGRTGGSKASSVCGAMLTSTSTFLGRWKYVKLVLDLARRWWRLKVKDMSPEKLQIISPTQLRPPQVFGLSRTQFDICYILNYQT